ncbi:uncharacterized protein LOC133927970 [Phragmites australis]|uniref:uncharacterized protein LOC133927970 n=1 Tax=Phragmites australis TaxID=29695 RepID=UPI002D77179E|nr:uncharacterized protein LOC133927970 [Phragmites australis]
MWSTFFLTLYGKFRLLSHVQQAAPMLGDPNWPNQPSYNLWTQLESQFRENKEAHAIYLNSEFHSLMQGTMSIADYFHKMKSLADALRDAGHPISDSTLVINTLHGLSPRFSNMAMNISMASQLPSFTDMWLQLDMQQMRMENKSHVVSTTALLTNFQRNQRFSSTSCGSTQMPSMALHAGGQGSGNKKNKKGKPNYGGDLPRQQTLSSSTPTPTGPWVPSSGSGIHHEHSTDHVVCLDHQPYMGTSCAHSSDEQYVHSRIG